MLLAHNASVWRGRSKKVQNTITTSSTITHTA
jgi:hypothetical protein